MKLFGNWSYPTSIRFGAGRIQELPEACAAAGMKNPLLVTDRGLADLPVTQKALDILDAARLGRAMFSGVDSNPTEASLDAGIAAYDAGRHDGVVAFGGGSGLDLGKLVAFMAGQNRPVWDFDDVAEVVFFDIEAEGVRGGRETAGNLDAERLELRHHLTERRVLAADFGHILAPKVLEPDQVAERSGFFGHVFSPLQGLTRL